MWYQLLVECKHNNAEQLSEELLEVGALSISFVDKNDEPILEPALGTTPLWTEVIIKVLFDDEDKAYLAQQYLKDTYPLLQTSIEKFHDQPWERICMQAFKPQRFGKRLWVCPSWKQPPEPEAVNLILDPGLAFGTGTHPTTQLCLEWLDQANVQDKSVIDFGCGSGILGLAALKLGARSVQAVDIDPQALQATSNNAEQNQLLSSQLKIAFPEALQPGADIILANILLTPLLGLSEIFYSLLTPKGELVISGILNEQTEQLITAYSPYFKHIYTQHLEEWALIFFQQKSIPIPIGIEGTGF